MKMGKITDAIGIPEEMLDKQQKSVCKINIDSDLRLVLQLALEK